MSVVLDASRLLAVAFRTLGYELARANLRDSLISSVNWSEVVQKVAQFGGKTSGLAELFLGWVSASCPSTGHLPNWQTRSPSTKARGLSLADRARLALGLKWSLEVIITDRYWAEREPGIRITVIRGGS